MPHGGHLPTDGIPAASGVGRQAPVRSTIAPTVLSANEVGGIAVCELTPPPSGFVIFVVYTSFETTSTSSAVCSVQIDGFQVDYANQVSDAAAEYRGLYVPTGGRLQYVFSGLSAGSTASVRLVWVMVPDIEAASWLGAK